VAQSTIGEPVRSFVRRVRSATRRKHTPEEKIRIVLEGFRSEVTVNDLCRREGIKSHSYYSWTKEFMEAGKERLARDSVRDATRQEIHALKRENGELKQAVADLSLRPTVSKNGHADGGGRRPCQRMSGVDKASILARVASWPVPKRQVLRDLGVPKSTYYRWLKLLRLYDRPGGNPTPWNRLTPKEQRAVLAVVRELPELSCRQVAAWITDNRGFSVSESTL